jgi:hypothetical protein
MDVYSFSQMSVSEKQYESGVNVKENRRKWKNSVFRIRIKVDFWIRIRIPNADPDPDPARSAVDKISSKSQNNSYHLELLD